MEKTAYAKRMIRPLILTLGISGLYHDHSKCSRVVHGVYASFITLMFTTVCLSEGYCTYITGLSRSITFHLLIKIEFIRQLIFTVWHVFCFPSRLNKFMELWSECSTYNKFIEVITMRFKIFLMCCLIAICAFLVTLLSLSSFSAATGDNISVCFGTDTVVAWPNSLLVSINGIFTALISVVLPLAYVTCGYIVQREFTNIKSKLESLIRDKQTVIDDDDVSQCRQEHKLICELLEVADDCFLPYSLYIYVYGVLYQCLSVYTILYEPYKVFFTPFLVAASTMFFLTFVISGIKAGAVHKSAHGLLGSLLELKTRQLKHDAYTEVMIFVTKLTTKDTGFTIMKIFVLSKTSVWTVLGTMVSYIIIAIQMKPSAGFNPYVNNTMTL